MAKRFTSTMKWNEDWYLDLSLANKLFWIYICDNSDHAGVFKPNKRVFELLVGSTINIKDFLEVANRDKNRIMVLANGRWYLTGFIEFQYGPKLNPNNRVHKSILKVLNENDIEYQKELLDNLDNICAESRGALARPSSIAEAMSYFKDKGSNKREAERFFYYYESQGWRVGKNQMKNWKMAASGWITRNKKGEIDSSYFDNQIKSMR